MIRRVIFSITGLLVLITFLYGMYTGNTQLIGACYGITAICVLPMFLRSVDPFDRILWLIFILFWASGALSELTGISWPRNVLAVSLLVAVVIYLIVLSRKHPSETRITGDQNNA